MQAQAVSSSGPPVPFSGGDAGRTLILEKTNRIGTKLLMSGSGQCNLTHGGSIKEFLSCYGQNGKRIRTVLYRHNNIEMQDFMHDLGITTIEREDGKIFPASLRAKDVQGALIHRCERNGVEIKKFRSCADCAARKRGLPRLRRA